MHQDMPPRATPGSLPTTIVIHITIIYRRVQQLLLYQFRYLSYPLWQNIRRNSCRKLSLLLESTLPPPSREYRSYTVYLIKHYAESFSEHTKAAPKQLAINRYYFLVMRMQLFSIAAPWRRLVSGFSAPPGLHSAVSLQQAPNNYSWHLGICKSRRNAYSDLQVHL